MNDISQIYYNMELMRTSLNYRTYYTIPHIGEYKFSARQTDYNGWIKCDGRALSTTEYAGLYDVIGTTFGDNGPGTFRLPNIQGRVPAAIGTSTASNHPMGEMVGAEKHTLTIAEMPSHNHTITDPGHTHTGDKYPSGVQSTDNAFGTETAAQETMTTGSVNTATTGITINNTGSNIPHNIMQPTIFIGNMFIFSGTRAYMVDPTKI
jgi:microcystin-dependent protein